MLDVGRRTRSIPPAIRRALWVRDRGCRFPGCRHTRFLHGHHVRHWLAGGETRLDNLVLLCSPAPPPTPRRRLVHRRHHRCRPRFPDRRREATVPVPHLPAVDDTRAALRAWAAEHGIEIGPGHQPPLVGRRRARLRLDHFIAVRRAACLSKSARTVGPIQRLPVGGIKPRPMEVTRRFVRTAATGPSLLSSHNRRWREASVPTLVASSNRGPEYRGDAPGPTFGFGHPTRRT